MTSVASFAELIQGQYGVSIPFFDGSLEEARREAQEEVRYLVVYLHCPTHEDTAAFLKSALADDEVLAHMAETCVLYGTSVMEEEGWRLAQELGIVAFPALAVTLKKSLVLRLQGRYNKTELLAEWATCTGMWDTVVAEEVSYRAEREQRELARVQEENALSEMERVDMERLARIEEEMAAKRAAAERARQAKAEAEERQRREEAQQRAREEQQRQEEARREAEELERRKMAARLSDAARGRLPPEPPADAEAGAVAVVSVRAMNGTQHQRRFARSDRVDALHDFALSVEEGYDGAAIELVTGFPPRPLAWTPGQTCIGDVSMLVPRALVVVRRAVR